ncbi:uncharacterized protein [Vicugna pacos]|uniref:Uncharacterized protein n=1 Tax=Vicugna pacos TaxID=30538 RepID=A0ABM5CZY2_VICPA
MLLSVLQLLRALRTGSSVNFRLKATLISKRCRAGAVVAPGAASSRSRPSCCPHARWPCTPGSWTSGCSWTTSPPRRPSAHGRVAASVFRPLSQQPVGGILSRGRGCLCVWESKRGFILKAESLENRLFCQFQAEGNIDFQKVQSWGGSGSGGSFQPITAILLSSCTLALHARQLDVRLQLDYVSASQAQCSWSCCSLSFPSTVPATRWWYSEQRQRVRVLTWLSFPVFPSPHSFRKSHDRPRNRETRCRGKEYCLCVWESKRGFILKAESLENRLFCQFQAEGNIDFQKVQSWGGSGSGGSFQPITAILLSSCTLALHARQLDVRLQLDYVSASQAQCSWSCCSLSFPSTVPATRWWYSEQRQRVRVLTWLSFPVFPSPHSFRKSHDRPRNRETRCRGKEYCLCVWESKRGFILKAESLENRLFCQFQAEGNIDFQKVQSWGGSGSGGSFQPITAILLSSCTLALHARQLDVRLQLDYVSASQAQCSWSCCSLSFPSTVPATRWWYSEQRQRVRVLTWLSFPVFPSPHSFRKSHDRPRNRETRCRGKEYCLCVWESKRGFILKAESLENRLFCQFQAEGNIDFQKVQSWGGSGSGGSFQPITAILLSSCTLALHARQLDVRLQLDYVSASQVRGAPLLPWGPARGSLGRGFGWGLLARRHSRVSGTVGVKEAGARDRAGPGVCRPRSVRAQECGDTGEGRPRSVQGQM